MDELIYQVVSFNTEREQHKHRLTGLYKEGKEVLENLRKSFQETSALMANLDPCRFAALLFGYVDLLAKHFGRPPS